MTLRLAALTAAVTLVTAGGAALASSTTAPTGSQVALRGGAGSDRNLRNVRRRLEGIIDSLQQDQHDYAGHRVRAIGDLQQARGELDAALAADAGH